MCVSFCESVGIGRDIEIMYDDDGLLADTDLRGFFLGV